MCVCACMLDPAERFYHDNGQVEECEQQLTWMWENRKCSISQQLPVKLDTNPAFSVMNDRPNHDLCHRQDLCCNLLSGSLLWVEYCIISHSEVGECHCGTVPVNIETM